jgi:hypothetical protein
MKLPGFAAEAPLSKTIGRYRITSGFRSANEYLVNRVVPQLPNVAECGGYPTRRGHDLRWY